MTQIKEVATEVEEKIEAVVGEVVTKAEAIAEEVVAEVKKVAERIRVDINTEEKLAVRELENNFLKAQMEMTRLQGLIQQYQKSFTSNIEGLTKKYVINPAEFVFDSIELAFKKKQ